MVIFDELEHAEYVIENGYRSPGYVNFDNIVMVKYWLYKGVGESQIRKMLYEKMIDYDQVFNRNLLEYKINKAIKIGKRFELRTNIVVEITDKEIEQIDSLKDMRLQKMLFILLVVWKARDMPKRFMISNTDLMKLSGVKVQSDIFWDYIHQIKLSGLLSMEVYKNKSYYVLHFDGGGKQVIKIEKFRNLMYHYFSVAEPEKYMKCEICGVMIKNITNRKYCKKCWQEVRRIQNKDNFNKWYRKQI